MVHYTTQMHRYGLGVKMAMGAKAKVLLVEQVANLEKPITSSAFLCFAVGVFAGLFTHQPTVAHCLICGAAMGCGGNGVFYPYAACHVIVLVTRAPVLQRDPIRALRND